MSFIPHCYVGWNFSLCGKEKNAALRVSHVKSVASTMASHSEEANTVKAAQTRSSYSFVPEAFEHWSVVTGYNTDCLSLFAVALYERKQIKGLWALTLLPPAGIFLWRLLQDNVVLPVRLVPDEPWAKAAEESDQQHGRHLAVRQRVEGHRRGRALLAGGFQWPVLI